MHESHQRRQRYQDDNCATSTEFCRQEERNTNCQYLEILQHLDLQTAPALPEDEGTLH